MRFSIDLLMFGIIGALASEIFRLYEDGALQKLLAYPIEKLRSFLIVRVAGCLTAGCIALAVYVGVVDGDKRFFIALAIGASAPYLLKMIKRQAISLLTPGAKPVLQEN